MYRQNSSWSKDYSKKNNKDNNHRKNSSSNRNHSRKNYSKHSSSNSSRQHSDSRRSNRRFRYNNQKRGGQPNSYRNYPRRRYRNRRSNRVFAQKIDHTRYIHKAIEVKHESPYVEEKTYADYELISDLQKNIEKRNYIHPTKIQDQTIPHILEGKDILGLASTGSGKTAAFLIPMVDKIYRDRNQRCLIIAPTRELAGQTRDELFKFNENMRIFSCLVTGGSSMQRQISTLRKRPHFVIGTPGRLKDLSERGDLKLNEFNNIVLDEVDRMLDMGFIEDIKEIISKLSKEKQTLFFSATMDRKSEEIARTLLKNPVKVQIAKQSAHKNVDQDIVKTKSREEKIEVLHELLIKEEFEKVLVFSKTKRGSDRLSDDLFKRGFKVDAIHGDKSQFKRNKVIERFKENRISILVATDVAARGLDINNVTHVINYDEPATYEDYIHRIGRTGRAGKKGTALTFV